MDFSLLLLPTLTSSLVTFPEKLMVYLELWPLLLFFHNQG